MSTTKEQQIAAIRAACIKANPEIVELTFGCNITLVDKSTWPDGLRHEVRILSVDGPLIVGLCEDNQTVYYNELEKLEDYKTSIIGRSIRLADVLLALSNKWPEPSRYQIWLDSELFEEPSLLLTASHRKKESDILVWNLLKDDLTLQSDEFISFFHSLICV